MINIRIIIVFAGFAVLIALIAGGIGGVPIVQILIRVLLWAVIFGLIGTGVSAVISKFLPELNQLINGENTGEKTYRGDFEAVIPEENPHDSLNQDTLFSNVKEETTIESGDNKADTSDLEELGAAEGTGEEIIEDKPIEEMKDMGGVPYIDAISEDEKVSDENIDNLDILPEIDSFATTFTPYSDTASNMESSSSESKGMFSKPKTNLDLGGFIEDPLKTAKAIHTWIEKDKEG